MCMAMMTLISSLVLITCLLEFGIKTGQEKLRVDHHFFLQVVDIQTGEPLGPNQNGEVCIRGPTVMKGN